MNTRILSIFCIVAAVALLGLGFVPSPGPADAAANPCPDVELVEFDQLPEGAIGEVGGSCFPTGVLCVTPSYNSVIGPDGGKYWCAFPATPTPVPTTPPLILPLLVDAPVPNFTG